MEDVVFHRCEMREFLKRNNCSTYKEVKERFRNPPLPQDCCKECIRCIGKAKSIDQYCKRGMVQYRDASGDEINLTPTEGIMKFMHEVVEGIKDIKENGYGNEDVWEEMKKKDFEKRTEKFNKRKKKALEKEEFEEYQKKKIPNKKHKRKRTSSYDDDESDSEKSHISIASDDDSGSSYESEFETV